MTPALAQLALMVAVAAIAVSAADVAVPPREPPREDSPRGEAGASRRELRRDDALSRESENLLRAEWVQAGLNTDRPTWGLRGGLLWGLPPAHAPSPDGPRGLIRLRYPVLPGGEYDLINFIAIEPVVSGRKGFSELESSQLDGVPGKRLWAMEANAPVELVTNLVAGTVTRLEAGVERLTVGVGVERFENGAHVGLTLSQRSDAPDELELAVHPQPDSAPIEHCILTATMGNKARARQLWLKDETVSTHELFPDYRDSGFTANRLFSLDRLYRTAAGEVLTAITTDEPDPGSVDPAPAAAHWRYRGFPVTQYWKKPAGTWHDDLEVAVNGRYTFWMSRHPIPGGVAFENFEMRERFRPGQRVVFGITHHTPASLLHHVVDTADPVPSRPATLRAGAASTPDDASASR